MGNIVKAPVFHFSFPSVSRKDIKHEGTLLQAHQLKNTFYDYPPFTAPEETVNMPKSSISIRSLTTPL